MDEEECGMFDPSELEEPEVSGELTQAQKDSECLYMYIAII